MTVQNATGKEEIFPIKWSAPEILTSKSQFSFASDVYAFAITMIEIYIDGQSPYGDMRNALVAKQVKTGWRMDKPEGCPEAVFALIQNCWAQEPADRPNFEKISDKLKELRDAASDTVLRQKIVVSGYLENGTKVDANVELNKPADTSDYAKGNEE